MYHRQSPYFVVQLLCHIINSSLVSTNSSEKSDYVVSEPIFVTFSPTTSFDIMEQEIFIPLVMDNINEATEGFFVVIDDQGIADQTLPIELERGGVTLVNIVDDDRKLNNKPDSNGIS